MNGIREGWVYYIYQETASTPAPAEAAIARCFSNTKGSRELNSILDAFFLQSLSESVLYLYAPIEG